MHVVGGRLDAHEDDIFAAVVGFLLDRAVRVEHDRATGRAGRRIEPARGDFELLARIDARVEQLVERGRVDARKRLGLA